MLTLVHEIWCRTTDTAEICFKKGCRKAVRRKKTRYKIQERENYRRDHIG